MSKTSILVIALLLVGCGKEDNKKERPATPRITKETKLVSPKSNQKIVQGEAISFELATKSAAIDSIVLEENGLSTTYTGLNFEVIPTTKKVGVQRMKLTAFFEGKKETHYPKIKILPANPPAQYTYTVVNTYPHDTDDYTQGLLIHDGHLYESTGQTSKSSLKKKAIESGEVVHQINLADDYFGEGLAIINDKFYQLTYTAGACFVYDETFEKTNTFNYQGQGWGLTTYQDKLLMTGSSEKIFTRDPSGFTVVDEIQVYDDKGKVESINEMEIIDGLIYANVYQEDFILVIDPTSGIVLQKIDMSGLLTDSEKRKADVLNGIAYDDNSNRIFVTGKLWPKLFEVKFHPKQSL